MPARPDASPIRARSGPDPGSSPHAFGPRRVGALLPPFAPALLLGVATLAASCAFMMPVATPPNAIVYGSGAVTVPQMVKAGIWLNLVFVALLTVAGVLLGG